jgi:hypothetical protein
VTTTFSTDTKCDTEGSRACEEFNATFNYVAPCLKTDCHQKAHIYDDQGNHCELNDIKQFLTKKLNEQAEEFRKCVPEKKETMAKKGIFKGRCLHCQCKEGQLHEPYCITLNHNGFNEAIDQINKNMENL